MVCGSSRGLNVIMLGPPGAGKGTQAERFARAHGVPKISTGDMLREAVHEGTELGLRAKAIMDRGELVSDEVMIGLVCERLNRPDAKRGFVLDGFPRTVPQAEALDRMTNGRGPLIVVSLTVPEQELARRLASRRICGRCGATADTDAASLAGLAAPADRCRRCGGALIQRSDDVEAVVLERLKTYVRETEPLVAFYRARPSFRSIDGAQPLDRVAADLAEAVGSAL